MKWKGIELKNIDNDYLLNIIGYVERKAKEGVVIFSGGGGPDPDEMWFSEDIIIGDEVLKHFHYDELLKEEQRRNFI